MNKEERNAYYDLGEFAWYTQPDNAEQWKKCPKCGLRPLTWTFDNGRVTMCGCGGGKSVYDGFGICAESIMSVYKRTGKTKEYDVDDLRKNWNHWCKIGEVLFERGWDGKY